jgi:ABC-type transporter lipoprotein component MlaA
MLVSACEELAFAAPHDGHAQFFLAAALAVAERRERRRNEQGSVPDNPFPYNAESIRAAWQAAREMQAASLKASGTPDTLPEVFDEIAQRLAPRD